MAELDVVGVFVAKPGSERVMQDLLNGLVEPTRAEDGCIAYDVFASNADSATFITVEKFRTQADLDAHMQTAHVQEALVAANDHWGAAPGIHPLRPAEG